MSELVNNPAPAELSILLPSARQALEKAQSVAEISHLVEYGQVCRVAATRAKLGKDSRDDWGEFVVDAEYKAGQMLRQMRVNGARAKTGHNQWSYDDDTTSDLPTLVDLGVADDATKARNRASRWGLIAELDEKQLTELKRELRSSTEKFIVEAAFIAKGKHLRREQEKRAKAAETAAGFDEKPRIASESWDEWLPARPGT